MKKVFLIPATVFALLIAAQAYAQPINRLSAEFLNFNGTETTTTAAACGPGATRVGCVAGAQAGTGGKLAYSKVIFVPYLNTPTNVLYVTISAVGDNHGGESNYLSCNVDGPGGLGSNTTVCNPTPTQVGVDGGPGGWITLTHHFAYQALYGSNGAINLSFGDGGGGTSDEHDNDYYYTWCKVVPPGIHTVNLRLGNFSGPTTKVPTGSNVFFEKAFLYVDASQTPVLGACSPAPNR